ncbi:MAG: hypothetical protein ABI877_13955 [Gemmatimonadaceae bacterium]
MINVIGDGGDRRHSLEDADGAKVGWIRGTVIGFSALQSEERAVSAALAAWRALERAFGRHYFGWKPQSARLDRLRFVHDGAYEWVAAGNCPLARLYRPPNDDRTGTFAIEIVLPSYASEAAAISVAQVLGNVVEPHRFTSSVRDPASLAPI